MAGRSGTRIIASFAEVAGETVSAEANHFSAAQIETFSSVQTRLAEN